MKLTEELLTSLGFVRINRVWDDGYMKLFDDQVPETLLGLVNIMTGNAYNKGKKVEAKKWNK